MQHVVDEGELRIEVQKRRERRRLRRAAEMACRRMAGGVCLLGERPGEQTVTQVRAQKTARREEP